MANLTAYLNFNGNGKEALSFYQRCFGGDLQITLAEGTPLENYLPPGSGNTIVNATLVNKHFTLGMSEMISSEGYNPGNNVSLMLNCEDEAEVNSFFEKLSENGITFLKPEKTFWGAYYGMLKDQFGIGWHLSYLG